MTILRPVAPDPSERPGPNDPPPYTRYRARRKPLSRGDRDGERQLPPPGGGADGDRPYTLHRAGGADGPRRERPRLRLPGRGTGRRISPGRVLGRVLLAALAWVVLSGVVFLVSAFVHRDDVGEGLASTGFPPFSATTVLVLGSDKRAASSKEPGAKGDAARADSILLMRVGGGHSARLSIPRDTVFDIPGRGRSKVNAAFAFGGASLMAETIQANLGISVDHVVEVSFSNFPDLIDAMGGIDYTGGCVVSRINGGFKNGGYTLRLKSGTTRIDGKQALALARTRKNDCNPRESDLTRARRQQKLFSAMKGRLISPGAFVRLPFISWAAPKSLRSDMGGPTLLGLFAGLATSGTPPTRILRPTGGETLPDGGQALTVSPEARQRAASRFLRE
jgi:LCP family protein required for cell wall assembly